MEDFILALFAAMVIGIPAAVVLVGQQGKKRGCGRGCSSCGNRHLCHPGQYENRQKPVDSNRSTNK
ncbi:MAG: hypothetical protein ACOX7N_01220 [Lawsonibacter sp.]